MWDVLLDLVGDIALLWSSDEKDAKALHTNPRKAIARKIFTALLFIVVIAAVVALFTFRS